MFVLFRVYQLPPSLSHFGLLIFSWKFHVSAILLECAPTCSQDKELREIRNQMQDRDADLDTLRKAGRNLRERLEEKDVETRDILDRVSLPCCMTMFHARCSMLMFRIPRGVYVLVPRSVSTLKSTARPSDKELGFVRYFYLTAGPFYCIVSPC